MHLEKKVELTTQLLRSTLKFIYAVHISREEIFKCVRI